MKPIPVIVIVPEVPFFIEAGFTDTSVGPTANAAVFVTVPVSRFVTVTSRGPVGAFAAIVTFTVSFVALLKVTGPLIVMPVFGENATVAPLWKPVPLITTFCAVAPWPSDVGAKLVIVGGVPIVSVKLLENVPPTESVTVTVKL